MFPSDTSHPSLPLFIFLVVVAAVVQRVFLVAHDFQRPTMASSKASFPSALSHSHSSNVLPTSQSLIPSGNWFYTTAAIVISLLVLEQTVYRYKKRHLPGSRWTIPLIGKFADSVNPTMEGYQRQWASGALSAISVFNMCVSTSSRIKKNSSAMVSCE